MFTGIVEEMGTVRRMPAHGRAGKLAIGASKVLEGTAIGDSIAVNGVCLTVVDMGDNWFSADVMPETLAKSSLGQLRAGSPVNLERALAANGRFGGHIVSGHIDGVGTIVEVRPDQNAVWVRIRTSAQIMALIVEKGSIAIDGISLTVAAVGATDFQVSLIPHTGEQTVLLRKKPGDTVNLENDVVGKYVQKLLAQALGKSPEQVPLRDAAGGPAGGITLEFLAENGF